MATNYKHLGNDGLQKLLQLLVTEFSKVQYEEAGKGLSTNDFTNELLAKLNGIEENANNYIHPEYTARDIGLYKVQVDATGHVVAVSAVEKADITGLGIPGQDTTYVLATAEADGLMSKGDFSKLAGIEEGANKYVHATHGAYDAGIYKITVDGEGHVTAASAVTKAELDAIIGLATQSENGLMSKEDKAKVDGLKALASKDQVAEGDLEESLKAKVNASHSHTNKDLLDTYTQSNEDLADAVTKKHNHENADELNKIAAGDKEKWDGMQAAAEATAAAELKKVVEGTIAQNTAAAAAAQSTADEAKAAAVTNAANITSGDAATLQSAKDYADAAVKAQIAAAYKASGTIVYEELPEPAEAVLGNVYNISNDFTTDADFVEGTGKQYKAGVNVAIVEIDGAYKYDVMAMSFDGFVQEANISEYSADDIQTLWTNAGFTA